MPVKLKCEVCDAEFAVTPSRANDARFCSSSCYGKYRSQAFRGSANPNWSGGPPSVTCNVCGKRTTTDSNKLKRNDHHFCSWACYAEWRNGKLRGSKHPNWRGGKMRPDGLRMPAHLSEAIRARDGHQCTRCGGTHLLAVHHIVQPRVGGTNDESNLRTLCCSCHAVIHHERGDI